MKDIKGMFVKPDSTIKDAIVAIQRGGEGIALVVDIGQRLIRTITDGDIRRAILKNINLDEEVSKLVEYGCTAYTKPAVAPIGTSPDKLLQIMKKEDIRHLPLLNGKEEVSELVLLRELIDEESHLPPTAIVMAGGQGQRMHPLTEELPKPMLPLDDRPLMERTIEQLRNVGIKKVNIATHYRSEAIVNHFGNGDTFGVDIDYINEDQPLGTAGALGLMEPPRGTTVVVNGDILTQLDFRAMYEFHRSHNAVMTVGVRKCELEVPYGVIEIDDVDVKNIAEKPVQTFIVNAGIYLIEPMAYKYIPENYHFDMTDLVHQLIKFKHKVVCFPIQEYWLDIGHPVDYRQAREDVKSGKI